MNLGLTFSDHPRALYLLATGETGNFSTALALTAEYSSGFLSAVLDPETVEGDYNLNPGNYPPDPQTGNTIVPAIALDKIPTQNYEFSPPVVSLWGLTVTIDGRDFSQETQDFAVTEPLSGTRQGTLTLKKLGSTAVSFDPDDLEFTPNQEVKITVNLAGIDVLLFTGFIVEPPQYSIESRNLEVLSIRVGDILELASQADTSQKQPYCGKPPRFARDASKILARKRGLGSLGDIPRGHRLAVAPVNEFLESSPHQLLQQIWEPTNRDVRTTRAGVVIISDRPVLEDATVTLPSLDYRETLDGSWDTGTNLPFSEVVVSNKFRDDRGFEERVTTYTEFSPKYQEGDQRAWFISDSTQTRVTETYLGDSLIRRTTEILGWIPNETSFNKALADSQVPCTGLLLPSGYTTFFGTVQTTTSEITTRDHPSGAKLITAERDFVEGYAVYESTTPPVTNYNVYQGILEDETRQFYNWAVADSRVCRKNWIILTTQVEVSRQVRRDAQDGLEPPLVVEFTQSIKYSRDRGVQTEQGEQRPWVKLERISEWSRELNKFVDQPPRRERSDPPNAKWVRPLMIPINLERTATNLGAQDRLGVRRAPNLSAPYAYTPDQLRTVGNRYLREGIGRSWGKTFVTSPLKQFTLGEFFAFTQTTGKVLIYQVAALEYRMSERQLTQVVTAWRWLG